MGGKVIVFQSVLPNMGPGTIVSRDDPKILDTAKASHDGVQHARVGRAEGGRGPGCRVRNGSKCP